jgi:hypothetical protein
MNHKPMSAWVDALRSGDYRHTPYTFYDEDRGGKMYSVLAVACMLYASDVFEEYADDCADLTDFIHYMGEDEDIRLLEIKHTIGDAGELALFELEMSGASINTIANYIQRRWA